MATLVVSSVLLTCRVSVSHVTIHARVRCESKHASFKQKPLCFAPVLLMVFTEMTLRSRMTIMQDQRLALSTRLDFGIARLFFF